MADETNTETEKPQGKSWWEKFGEALSGTTTDSEGNTYTPVYTGRGGSSFTYTKRTPSGEVEIVTPLADAIGGGKQTAPSALTDEEIAAGKTEADKYWEDQLKLAREQNAYNPGLYNRINARLDEYEQKYQQLLGGPQGLSAQVEGAYGAAAARGRQGAQNIRQQGQRAAAGIDAAYGEAAARAEGLAAGQGLGETTALSGFIPVSGEAAYTPTVGRAYGLAAADFTGGMGTIAADELGGSSAARGSGRMTLDQWAKTNMLDIRMRLDFAHDAALENATNAQTKAAADIALQRSRDEFTTTETEEVLKMMDAIWEADNNPISQNVRKIYGDDKKAFLAAVEARIKMNSNRAFERWFNQYRTSPEMLGQAPIFTDGSL